jgi:hypothetical protein
VLPSVAKKKGCCGIGVVHRGIPHGEACPLGGGAHGSGLYPWQKVGGRGEEC